MGYSVKWVENNMGITRRTLRYYEEKGLLPKNQNSEYRNYSEDDLKRIWLIKTFLSIGFTTKELKNLSDDSEDIFYDMMSKKIEDLEKDLEKKQLILDLARTMKISGRIPDIKKIGTILFDDFFDLSKEKFQIKKNISVDKYVNKYKSNDNSYSDKDIEAIKELIQKEDIIISNYIQSYYTVLSDFQEYDSNSDFIQSIVKQLYLSLKKYDKELTPFHLFKYYDPHYFEGDIRKMNELKYGEKGLLFISNAISNFYINSQKGDGKNNEF